MSDLRQLISAAKFRELARKGISPDDMGQYAVFKALAERRKQIDRAGRIVPFILSNVREDREGDTIQVEGWDLSDYIKNPVVLWAHSHDLLPIASAVRTWIEGRNLRADDQFVGPDLFPFADTVFRMLDLGYLNACSVGFQPTEWDMGDRGVNFIKQVLLEHSVCPVPAHPEALVAARSKGIDTRPLRDWAERTLDLFGRKNISDDIRADLERLRVQADPSGKQIVAILRDVASPPDATDDPAAALPTAPVPEQIALAAGGTGTLQRDDCEACGGTGCKTVNGADAPCQDCSGTGFKETIIGVISDEAPAAAVSDPPPVKASSDQPASCDPVNGACPAGYEMSQDGMCHIAQPGSGEGAAAADAAAADGERTPAAIQAKDGGSEMIRWNPRLSKAFDVSHARFPARSYEEALVSKHLGTEIKHLERRTTRIPSVRMGSWLTAIHDLIAQDGWQVRDVRNLDYKGEETPPLYESIRLNSSLSEDFLVDGMRFLQCGGDDDGIRATLRVEPAWYGLDITLYGVRELGTAGSLLSDLSTRAKAINFLKGEAFAISGDFLPVTDEGMDSLFLSAKNAKSVKRILDLINTRGAELENRGAIFMGPPGTGKTLAGRILRNQAKATFIWVAARDFQYLGGFGGFTEALDLARECAPSIVFYEDVDNWLTSWNVDLLKSELDGIARSKGVVTILTTNFPELMPAALIDRPGRFHDVLQFDLPDGDARRSMLKLWLPDLSAADLERAVTASNGFSGAHVRELARFAEIIAEQDDLDSSAALTAALAKLAEQRELITQVQTSGSRYRMPSACQTKGLGSIPTGDVSAAPRGPAPETRTETAIAPAATPTATGSEKAGRVLSQKNESDLRTAQDCMTRVLASVDGKTAKRGRALSAANEDRLRQASGLLDDVLTQLAQAADEGDGSEDGTVSASVGEVDVVLTIVSDPVPVPVPQPAEASLVLAGGFDPGEVVRETIGEMLGERVMRLTGRVDLG